MTNHVPVIFHFVLIKLVTSSIRVMPSVRWFSKYFASMTKVASALEGLNQYLTGKAEVDIFLKGRRYLIIVIINFHVRQTVLFLLTNKQFYDSCLL